MITIIGILLGILISSLWIFLPLKRVPESIRLKKSTYILSIVIGATLCTLIIAVLELKWDDISGIPANDPRSIAEAALAAFTRAALLEEAVKYFFVRRVLKKHKPQGRLQYMLLAATIGMGYGITEKLMMSSALSMLINAVFSLHIMYQMISGYYLYEADKTEDAAKKKVLAVKAFLVPFLLHGVWDFVLFGVTVYVTNTEASVLGWAAVILMAVTVVAGIAGEVLMALYLKRTEPAA